MSWLTEHLFGAKNSNGTNIEEGQEPIDQVKVEDETGLSPSKETVSTDVNTAVTVATDESTAGVLSMPPTQAQLAIDDAYEKREIVAEWRVPLRGKLHKIEFEHGTTSGRRILWIDEKVIQIIPFVTIPRYCTQY